METEPLVRTRQQLLAAGVQSADLDTLEAETRAAIHDASLRALDAPVADPATVKEHLYA
jgi:TPP-dependent pyruvate/acetoin dehydrogenase alpha subunit